VSFLCLVAILAIMAPAAPAIAQSLDVASYDIEVTLDPERHHLDGTETVTWRNTTEMAATEVWLHLYLNAFASSESTFLRELARDAPDRVRRLDGNWGWIRLTRLVLDDGTDLSPAFHFERPDDGNPEDYSLARVELPRPVLPGVAITLKIAFEAQLPRVIVRTGFDGDFYLVGQWFPKLAVFQGSSGWSCHQFHAASEFFADFGSYRVRMTVPRGWVVGATGEQVARRSVGRADQVEYRAAAVHDFAWTTAPADLMAVVETDFEPGRDVPTRWLEEAATDLERPAADLELAPVTIRLLLPHTQSELEPRMVRAIRLAMAWFGLRMGPYPYPQLTVVSPPPGAGAAGGMEYPTFITTGVRQRDAYPPWRWLASLEALTVHEFGHQYFQGLVASNESQAAWLDEGLTTWAENHCLDAMISDGLIPEVHVDSGWVEERLAVALQRPPLTIDRRSWEYRRLIDYYVASYAKAAIALRTLEGLLGEAQTARAVRAYVDAFRYHHPSGHDLQGAFEDATGENLDWFFDGAVRGSAEPDWAVLEVRHRRLDHATGMVWSGDGWVGRDDSGSGELRDERSTERWQVEIELGRLGDLSGPVEVELDWSDGRSERRRWDGHDRWVRWRLDSVSRLAQVRIDPDAVWALETRRADNYWRDQPAEDSPIWWLGQVLRFVGELSLPWS